MEKYLFDTRARSNGIHDREPLFGNDDDDRRELKKCSIWWRDLVLLGGGANIDSCWFGDVIQLAFGKMYGWEGSL